ncbi:MAG: alanyl-tRNA editing protein [Spirochaetaceae bacterium]
MSETLPLYYEDAYRKECTARVLESRKGKNGYEVILDQTCFYPEGGGQPGDRGTLGEAAVVDTRKGEKGEIIHITDEDPGEGVLTATLDWEYRFEYMQQHTGQHVLSGALYRQGYNTVSVHQGSEYTTIEVDSPTIPEETLIRVEEEANGVIRANLPVRDFEVDESQIERYDLRRTPKVSGIIRLVEIEGWDLVACGGVHTASTGEVGLLHAVRVERIRGNSRIYWKIGKRAYEDYRAKTSVINDLTDRLSAQLPEIPRRVERLEGEAKNQEYRKHQLEEAYSRLFLDSRLKGDQPAIPVIVETLPPEAETSLLQRIVQDAAERETIALLLFLPDGDGGFRWSLTIKGTESFPQEALRRELLPAMEAKGGGKPPLWQGKAESGDAPNRGAELFQAIVSAAS